MKTSFWGWIAALLLLLPTSATHAQSSFSDYPAKSMFFLSAGVGGGGDYTTKSPGWTIGYMEGGRLPFLGPLGNTLSFSGAFESGAYLSYRKFTYNYLDYYGYNYDIKYTQLSFAIKGLLSLNPLLHIDPSKLELLVGGSAGYDFGLVQGFGYAFPGAGTFVAPHAEGRLWLGRLGLTGAIGRQATGFLNVGATYNFHKG